MEACLCTTTSIQICKTRFQLYVLNTHPTQYRKALCMHRCRFVQNPEVYGKFLNDLSSAVTDKGV